MTAARVSGADSMSGEHRRTPVSGRGAAASVSRLCKAARLAVPFYRGATHAWQKQREAQRLADRTPIVRDRSCHWARYAAAVWVARAKSARKSFARWIREMRIPEKAICHVFRGRYCAEALGVTACEAGPSRTPRAHNGQYLGVFQMGSSERRLFGHGASVLEQARAAWRYFDRSGRDWSPWSCRWAAYS